MMLDWVALIFDSLIRMKFIAHHARSDIFNGRELIASKRLFHRALQPE